MNFIIYVVTNTVNKKRYVGMTKLTLKRRWARHVGDAKRLKYYFYRAITKYGANAFTVAEIDRADNKEDAVRLERKYIAEFRTAEPEFGYNSTYGGEWLELTPAAKEKMRLALWDNPEWKKAHGERMRGPKNFRYGRKPAIYKSHIKDSDLVRLYENLGYKGVGKVVGLGGNSVRYRLKKLGVKTRKPGQRLNNQSGNIRGWREDLSTEEIVRLYESGLSTISVAKQLGCNYQTVCSRLKMAGVKINKYRYTFSRKKKVKTEPSVETIALAADKRDPEGAVAETPPPPSF